MLLIFESKYLVKIMILIVVIWVSFSLNPFYVSPAESSEKAGFLILMPDDKWIKALSGERFFVERSKRYNVYITYPPKKVTSEIRKLITEYKEKDENLKYLLIIGDYTKIPPYSFDKGYMGLKYNLVTDYYYMDLTGEYPWKIHFPPDIYAGRIWAKDPNEAKNKLEAIIEYEHKPQSDYPLSYCGGYLVFNDSYYGLILKDSSYLGEVLKKASKEKMITLYEVNGTKKSSFESTLPLNINNVKDVATKSPIATIYPSSERNVWYDSNKNKKIELEELQYIKILTEDMYFNGILILGDSFGGTKEEVLNNYHQYSPILISFTSDALFIYPRWTAEWEGWLDSQLLYIFRGLLNNKGTIGENILNQLIKYYEDFWCFGTSSTCYLRTVHYNLMGMQFFGDPTMELPDLKLSEIPKVDAAQEMDMGIKTKAEYKIKNSGNSDLLCKIIESPSWVKLSSNECEIKPGGETVLTIEVLTDHSLCHIPSRLRSGIISIITNDPKKPRFEIKIRAKVL